MGLDPKCQNTLDENCTQQWKKKKEVDGTSQDNMRNKGIYQQRKQAYKTLTFQTLQQVMDAQAWSAINESLNLPWQMKSEQQEQQDVWVKRE